MSEYKWCAIDAEGDVGKRGLRGVAFYQPEYQEYLTDHDQIKEYLEYHAESGFTFLSHNASYDIPVIFHQLRIPVRIIFYNNRFNRGEWKYHPKRPPTQIWDTVGLSGGLGLAALGKALNLPKLDTPQNLAGTTWSGVTWTCDRHHVEQCEICYAIRDAEIVHRFMTDFETLLAGWGVKPGRRLAGIAVNLWRTLDPRPPIRNHLRLIEQLGRDAYHGGRVETFKLGHVQPAYSADVCSMYPSIMASVSFPEPRSIAYREHVEPYELDLFSVGVADVTVQVPSMYIPPLVYNDNGYLKYPVGRFRGCWTLHELRYAVELGCKILAVHRVASTSDVCKPFDTFIGTLWELRQYHESMNDPRTLFDKLLMNNLYGRIGMREGLDERIIVPVRGAPEKGKNTLRFTRQTDSGTMVEDQTTRYFTNPYANVIWAAQITGGARVKMHRLMRMQGNAMVYSDTDSIFSMAPIVGLGEGLGALRDPVDLAWMYVAQPKLYAYQTMTGGQIARAKGIPRDRAMEFIRDGVVTFDRPITPLQAGRRGISAGTWVAMTRSRGNVPHRRQPLRPVSELGPYEWTDTMPPVVE